MIRSSVARAARPAADAFLWNVSPAEMNHGRVRAVIHDMAPRNSTGQDTKVATVTSAALTAAPAHAVYAFLIRLPNHALITGRRLRLEHIASDGRGARIAMRGPLGIRRTARTSVTDLVPSQCFGGTAAVGRRTIAYVHWGIDHAETGSLVTLTATILRAGALDRVLLALGGRRWLARSFERAVELLGAALDAEESRVRMAG